MNWIIPSNAKHYRTVEAFQDLKIVEWGQKANFRVGDNVFIYSSLPTQMIEVWAVVKRINKYIFEHRKDYMYWKTTPKAVNPEELYMELELVKINKDYGLHLDYLMEHGLKGAPQRPQKLRVDTYTYIKSVFSNTNN